MDDNWGYPYFRKPPFLQMGKTNGGTRFSMAHGKRDEYHCLIAIAKWFTHHFSHSHGYFMGYTTFADPNGCKCVFIDLPIQYQASTYVG